MGKATEFVGLSPATLVPASTLARVVLAGAVIVLYRWVVPASEAAG